MMANHGQIAAATLATIELFNELIEAENLCMSCAYDELILSLFVTGLHNGLIDPNDMDAKMTEIVEKVPVPAPMSATKH